MNERTYKQGDKIAVIATVIKQFDDGRIMAELNKYGMIIDPENLAATQPLPIEEIDRMGEKNNA